MYFSHKILMGKFKVGSMIPTELKEEKELLNIRITPYESQLGKTNVENKCPNKHKKLKR
jgi:hypothetical protein